MQQAMTRALRCVSGARVMHSGAAILTPDLYGDRTDRDPCPSPLPGLTVDASRDDDNHRLPEECYPIHDDPSAPHAHPANDDFYTTQQHPKDATPQLTRTPAATASAGDPGKPVDKAKKDAQDQAQAEPNKNDDGQA